jgi:hypothetical protein
MDWAGGGGCIKLEAPPLRFSEGAGQIHHFMYARFYSFLLRKNANSLQEFCGVGRILYHGCCFNNVVAVAVAADVVFLLSLSAAVLLLQVF